MFCRPSRACVFLSPSFSRVCFSFAVILGPCPGIQFLSKKQQPGFPPAGENDVRVLPSFSSLARESSSYTSDVSRIISKPPPSSAFLSPPSFSSLARESRFSVGNNGPGFPPAGENDSGGGRWSFPPAGENDGRVCVAVIVGCASFFCRQSRVRLSLPSVSCACLSLPSVSCVSFFCRHSRALPGNPVKYIVQHSRTPFNHPNIIKSLT